MRLLAAMTAMDARRERGAAATEKFGARAARRRRRRRHRRANPSDVTVNLFESDVTLRCPIVRAPRGARISLARKVQVEMRGALLGCLICFLSRQTTEGFILAHYLAPRPL